MSALTPRTEHRTLSGENLNDEALVFRQFEVAIPGKGKIILDGKVGAKERLVLRGPSGCGKTTLLRAIAGLLKAERGEVRLGDKILTGLSTQERQVGFVFQSGALFSHLSLLENILFGLNFSAKTKSWSEALKFEKGRDFLKRVNLAGLEDRAVLTLSGGERQRVALARALIWEPAFLLLDEPLSAVDPALRYEMQLWILERLKEYAVPAIVITHDINEAEVLGTKVLDWTSAKILEDGLSRCFTF